MSIKHAVLALGVLTLLSCSTTGETAATDDNVSESSDAITFEVINKPHTDDITDTTEASVDPDQTRVCKSLKKSGSLFREKICRTQAEWDALSDEGHKTMNDLQRGGNWGS